MTFTTFSDNMLKAVFEEDRSGTGMVDLLDLPQRYGFSGNAEWVHDWALANGGFLKFASNPPPEPPNPLTARLNGSGRLQAEQRFGDKSGVPPLFSNAPNMVTEDGGTMLTENGQSILLEGIDSAEESGLQPLGGIDSSQWTGLPSNFVLTAQRQAELLTMLEDAERNLDAVGASNADKSMARAYIIAARALADVPDPPADIIWELISRANQLAGIASLFVSIIALFAAAK